ncbi:hypothetical protein GCM10027059_49990 [Myceligenerans halotolerans]
MVLAMSRPEADTAFGLPQVPPAAEGGFDLDITVIESGPDVEDLFSLTNDNCGTTCESACTSCK